MTTRRLLLGMGACLFLTGGGLLAFSGTTLGTGLGMAGLGLIIIAWSWAGGN